MPNPGEISSKPYTKIAQGKRTNASEIQSRVGFGLPAYAVSTAESLDDDVNTRVERT